MANLVTVSWLDPGSCQGRIEQIARRYILTEGELHDGQEVLVQMTRKKSSKAKVWHAVVIKMTNGGDDDDSGSTVRGRTKKRDKLAGQPPKHILNSMEKLKQDNFVFQLGDAPVDLGEETGIEQSQETARETVRTGLRSRNDARRRSREEGEVETTNDTREKGEVETTKDRSEEGEVEKRTDGRRDLEEGGVETRSTRRSNGRIEEREVTRSTRRPTNDVTTREEGEVETRSTRRSNGRIEEGEVETRSTRRSNDGTEEGELVETRSTRRSNDSRRREDGEVKKRNDRRSNDRRKEGEAVETGNDGTRQEGAREVEQEGEREKINARRREMEEYERQLAERKRKEEEEYERRLIARRMEEEMYEKRMTERRRKEEEEYKAKLIARRREEEEYQKRLTERRKREEEDYERKLEARRNEEHEKQMTKRKRQETAEDERLMHMAAKASKRQVSPLLFSSDEDDDSLDITMVQNGKEFISIHASSTPVKRQRPINIDVSSPHSSNTSSRLDRLEHMLTQFISSGASSGSPATVQPPQQTSITPSRQSHGFESGADYNIPIDMLKEASEGCRSRRNLAGRLTSQLFSIEEMSSSNFRGVLNKKKLDSSRTAAIKRACYTEFPAKQQETTRAIDKEIREGIDEMCRRKARGSKVIT